MQGKLSGIPNPVQSPLPIVLQVEDDADDAFFLKRAIEKSGLQLKLAQVGDGQQAIDFLKDGSVSETGLPDVVLLDLKLPKVSGFEVLEWMRKQDWSKDIRIVVLTSSSQPEDLERARQLGVEWYLNKSPSCHNVLAILQRFLGDGASA